MYNDHEKYKILSARHINLSHNRLVGLADLENTETGNYAKALFFISKYGKETKVCLSLEAYDALKILMTDSNAGDGGQTVLTKMFNAIDQSEDPPQIIWKRCFVQNIEETFKQLIKEALK